MSWFYNLKLSHKLMAAFLMLALITGMVGYVGINKIRIIKAADTTLYQENVLPFQDLNSVALAFQMRRVQLKDMLINLDYAKRQKIQESITGLDQTINDSLARLDSSSHDDNMRRAFTNLKDALEMYEPIKNEYIKLAMENKLEEARYITTSGDGVKAAHAVDAALDNFTNTLTSEAKRKSDTNAQIAHSAALSMIVLIIIAVTLALLLGWFISRIINRPLQEMLTIADRLALGDINVSLSNHTKDEIGMLSRSFAALIENIRMQALAAEKIAAGDMQAEVRIRSENDLLNLNLNHMLNSIKALIGEAVRLRGAIKNGQLNIRADVTAFSGGWREIPAGINDILDAVTEPLQESLQVLQEMAQGNLQIGMQGDYQGDLSKIKTAINNTIHAFNELLGEINLASEQVASGAEQVSQSSQSLSQASTEQASAVEEITATMGDISRQTRQNALDANKASELAISAKENAIQGNREMQELQRAMADINDSSSNISKIIKVIDEIAFQTNILALNAAVEAARAGQHGKGFAVVAEEVRNLAARSADAAKETTAMIEGSIKKVELGTQIANDTAQALNRIVEGVSIAADLVGNIAAASNEQATAIAQINQGIAGVAEVTQMNTATAQESAAASQELASQAELLQNQVSRFKLKLTNMPKINGVNPEVLKMLEKFTSANPRRVGEHYETKNPGKVRIDLDDQDFGKY